MKSKYERWWSNYQGKKTENTLDKNYENVNGWILRKKKTPKRRKKKADICELWNANRVSSNARTETCDWSLAREVGPGQKKMLAMISIIYLLLYIRSFPLLSLSLSPPATCHYVVKIFPPKLQYTTKELFLGTHKKLYWNGIKTAWLIFNQILIVSTSDHI